MSNDFTFKNTIPVAPLKLCALESCRSFAEEVDRHIVTFRKNDTEELLRRQASLEYRGYDCESYLLSASCPRFGTGEGKGVVHESVRGTDLFIMVDVVNYSLTYTVCGHQNHMSPDDHYQDLKRIIGATIANAHRVNVIMPFLYESRQHKRTKRESLDSAYALEELSNMGVENIITFDAHDPRVQNAIPLHGFDNFMPTYQFVKAVFERDNDIQIDKDHLMVISPDEGAMGRAVYFANNLNVNMGMFYKRRDYTRVINGRNPIVAHEFLGDDVTGKTIIIVDDMISSGESMLDTARELKDRHADKVIICCTFGLCTDGFEKFDEFHQKGYFDYVVTTNLNYRPDELKTKPWYIEADMTKFTAAIINTINHDQSINNIIDPSAKIQKLISRYNAARSEQFRQLELNL